MNRKQVRVYVSRRGRSMFLVLSSLLVVSGLLPAASAAPPGGSTSTCSLPASDTCKDFVSKGRRWSNLPIPYYVNPLRAPLGAEQDVQDAFSAWENEAKSPTVEAMYPGDASRLDFVYMGTTTAVGGRDGKNVVYFAPSSGTAAVTLSAKGGQLAEFDLVLNANWSWSTDVTCPSHACGTVDLQNVVTHEVGHVIDLYHVTGSANSLQTMYPYPADPAKRAANDWSDETVKRDLSAGEILALRKAYPAN